MTLRMIEREKYNEGINQGKAGSLVNSVDNLIKNLDLSLEEACTALGSSVQEYEKAKELLKEQQKKSDILDMNQLNDNLQLTLIRERHPDKF